MENEEQQNNNPQNQEQKVTLTENTVDDNEYAILY